MARQQVQIVHHVVLDKPGVPPIPLVRRARDGYEPVVYLRRDAADRAAARWNADHPEQLVRVDSYPSFRSERVTGRARGSTAKHL